MHGNARLMPHGRLALAMRIEPGLGRSGPAEMRISRPTAYSVQMVALVAERGLDGLADRSRGHVRVNTTGCPDRSPTRPSPTRRDRDRTSSATELISGLRVISMGRMMSFASHASSSFPL